MRGKKSAKAVKKVKVAKKGKTVKATKSLMATTNKPITDKQTKNQIISSISEETGITKKEVNAIFQSLASHIHRHMTKRGSGIIVIPETSIKVKRIMKPATKKRLGRNPATGEQIMIAAKPARTVVKVSALKALKEAVNS